jgi:hypothetical protein
MLEAQGMGGDYHCPTPRGWKGETAGACLSPRRRVAVPEGRRIQDLQLWLSWSRDTREVDSSTSRLD